jgi:hypothetical protein
LELSDEVVAVAVGTDLRDHALGGPLADPGDGVEVVAGLSERGDDPVDLTVEPGDVRLEESTCSRNMPIMRASLVAEEAT